MKKNKVIFLLRSETTNWGAVNLITPLLENIYMQWKNKHTQVYSFTINKHNSHQIIASILKMAWRPGVEPHIVTIDHSLNYKYVSEYAQLFEIDKVCFHFHIFGDAIFRIKELLAAKKNLCGYSANFYVASTATKVLLSKIFDVRQIHMTPLPISDHFFKHKPAVTNMDQVKIAYIGRFSADKGVANLLNWWSHNAHSMGACRLSLLLVGELSHDQKYSLVTKKWRKDQHKLLLKHIKRTPRNVRILPSQTTQQLAKLLSKIDYLISFSTFPLEEFGMALAAGAASGTGLLISRWAGHENFNSAPHRHFLPIAGGASPFVNTRNLSTLLCKLKPLSKSQRQQQILWAKKVVSQKHVSKIIRSNFATKIKVPAISTNDKKLRLDKKRWIELCKNIIAQD